MTPVEKQLIRAMAAEDKMKRELFRANGTIVALQQEVADLKSFIASLEAQENADDFHRLNTGAKTGCDSSDDGSCSICGK